MKKSNIFFKNIKEVEAYVLENTCYGEEPDADLEEQPYIEGNVLVIPATFDNMLPEVRIWLDGNYIILSDSNKGEFHREIICRNEQEAFDNAWFNIFDDESEE